LPLAGELFETFLAFKYTENERNCTSIQDNIVVYFFKICYDKYDIRVLIK